MKTNTTSAISRKAATLFAFVVTMLLLIWLVWPEHRRSAPPRLESASLATAVISSEAIVPLPDSLPDLDQRKIALGNLLFHDPSLSQDNTIACASCHILQQGGVDGKKLSIGIKGRLSLVNAPTVYNSGFNFRQFWDGRAEGLEEQVAGPIHNPQEMGSNWPEVITKLRKNSAYETTFKKIYGNGITSDNIADAIATFVRSLITPNARFDKYLKGDSKAITPYELS